MRIAHLDHADGAALLPLGDARVDQGAVKPQVVVVEDDEPLDFIAGLLHLVGHGEGEAVAGDDVGPLGLDLLG